MNMISADVKDMLISDIVLGLTFGTNLFVGKMPSTPKNIVAVFDAGGLTSDRSFEGKRYHRDSFSVKVRNTDYVAGYEQAEQIEQFLISNSQTVWNTVLYTSITSESGVLPSSWDDNANYEFMVNFNVQRTELTETTYPLTTIAGVGGSFLQSYTNEPIINGTKIPIAVIPADGYIIDEVTINTIETTENLFIVTVNKAIEIVANFIASGFQTILKTFQTAPVNKGDKYYFGDYSGNDNDSEIKNVRVADFSTSQIVTVNSSVYNVGGEPIDLTIEFYYNNLATTSTRILYRSGGSGGRGLSVVIATNQVLQISQYSGASTMTWNTVAPVNTGIGWKKLHITWGGQTGGVMSLEFFANGYSLGVTTNSGTFGWSGNSTEVIKLGHTIGSYNSYIQRVILANKFEWILNHGQGATIYDISGNGNNGVLTGAVLATFWGSTADGIEPYDTTLGATLYRNISTGSIMPICANVAYEISGYERLGYFPAGSGILRGLPNKYNLVGNSEVPQGDYTADQIAAFTNSEIVEVTQNANAVTQLILKS